MRKRILRMLFLAACVAAGAAMGGGEAQAEPLKITVTPPHKQRDYDQWLVLQFRCMADAVYTEARGEDDYDQHLMAYVIMRRIQANRPEWPKTPCGNVYKVGFNKKGELVSQFSGPVHNPVKVADTDTAYQNSARVGIRVMLGYWKPRSEDACAIAYLNKKDSSASRMGWYETLVPIGARGKHSFYCLPDSKVAKR